MEYLSGLGHVRIAYIGPTPVKTVEKERMVGYVRFMENKFGSIDQRMIFTGKAYSLLGYDATKEILSNDVKPTAIVAYNDNLALGVIRAVLESGLSIPNDISVVGFDGLEIGLYAYPPLPTVAVPLKQMADAAVDLLIQRIEALQSENKPEGFSPQKIQFEPHLVIRDSTGSVIL
jgi:LacI family transcriptional regulator